MIKGFTVYQLAKRQTTNLTLGLFETYNQLYLKSHRIRYPRGRYGKGTVNKIIYLTILKGVRPKVTNGGVPHKIVQGDKGHKETFNRRPRFLSWSKYKSTKSDLMKYTPP